MKKGYTASEFVRIGIIAILAILVVKMIGRKTNAPGLKSLAGAL